MALWPREHTQNKVTRTFFIHKFLIKNFFQVGGAALYGAWDPLGPFLGRVLLILDLLRLVVHRVRDKHFVLDPDHPDLPQKLASTKDPKKSWPRRSQNLAHLFAIHRSAGNDQR